MRCRQAMSRSTLLAARYRNTTATWKANDIFDVDALAVAAPYCDVVATDRAVVSAATSNHLDERLQTLITAQIDEVSAYVEQLLREA